MSDCGLGIAESRDFDGGLRVGRTYKYKCVEITSLAWLGSRSHQFFFLRKVPKWHSSFLGTALGSFLFFTGSLIMFRYEWFLAETALCHEPETASSISTLNTTTSRIPTSHLHVMSCRDIGIRGGRFLLVGASSEVPLH